MTPTTGQKTDRQLLESISHDIAVMNVKLFGNSDPDEENETGRLGKVERSSKSAHERLDKVYRYVYITIGALMVLEVILRVTRG